MKASDYNRKRAPDKERCQELRTEGISIGEIVQISGLNKRYRVVEIFPEYQSVRVQELDDPQGTFMYLPRKFLKPSHQKPVVRSKSLTRTLGDALFRGSHVYRVNEPDRVLKVRQICWDRESSWVEDENGRIFELAWDETEFWEN